MTSRLRSTPGPVGHPAAHAIAAGDCRIAPTPIGFSAALSTSSDRLSFRHRI